MLPPDSNIASTPIVALAGAEHLIDRGNGVAALNEIPDGFGRIAANATRRAR